MLPLRSAATVARHVSATLPPAAACIVCTCSCGNLFRNRSNALLPATARRTKVNMSGRSAPKMKAMRSGRTTLTSEEAKRRKDARETLNLLPHKMLTHWYRNGWLQIVPDNSIDFLNDLAELAQASSGRPGMDVGQFRQLAEKYGLSVTGGDVLGIAVILVNLGRNQDDNRFLGQRLLHTLSEAGNVEATLRVLNHELVGSKADPNRLRSATFNTLRGHLRQHVREGREFRTCVLEGRIAYALGDEDYAISMWERSLDLAAEWSERTRPDALGRLLLRRRDEIELTSPWIELTLVYFERYDKLYRRGDISKALLMLDKSRRAMEIGCRQDDPTSHYHAAEFFKEVSEDGSTRYTSTWLYNMTKAAASGHVKAAHALGVFYESTGWKYIEDEPPDHIKPTPFDSYPPPATTQSPPSGFLSSIRSMFGSITTSRMSETEASRLDLFQTAVFPSTPLERWTLALRWLEVAMDSMYAPAYLQTAKMLLETSLWANAQAPPSALDMTPARYTYASKEDFDAGRPLPSANEGFASEDIPAEDKIHDPLLARKYLTEIFHAHRAVIYKRERIAHTQAYWRKMRQSSRAEGHDLEDHEIPSQVPEDVRKWLRWPDVMEMYEGEMDGLVAQAKWLCDKHEWDVLDERGGLLYKANLGNVQLETGARGAAAAAAAAA
ncbi:hypothetical protein BAUCODRAFT_383618 [Baudoinia panamericana UAMH 10762]|uniref:Uncharacterized protein n=1 Tax=Baudoinia panamericana (strain UAMH 10762) TaxID=717646 RepID=M2LW55_BAUPA|nr:uncharacterized protein BAUCODRAFT_383618 [Baudoinia panamericana UAMH 10762]EMC98897.1 hypothetical protein BAUCODRAFT_383618 [Baudoinia panamericana UAMH 10762]